MSVDPIRAEFESWFTSTYGPDPTPGELLANLTEAARLQAFTAGAWAAWKHWAAGRPCDAIDIVRRADGTVEYAPVYEAPP